MNVQAPPQANAVPCYSVQVLHDADFWAKAGVRDDTGPCRALFLLTTREAQGAPILRMWHCETQESLQALRECASGMGAHALPMMHVSRAVFTWLAALYGLTAPVGNPDR
jgi:hypothetical protein